MPSSGRFSGEIMILFLGITYHTLLNFIDYVEEITHNEFLLQKSLTDFFQPTFLNAQKGKVRSFRGASLLSQTMADVTHI